MLHDSVRNRKHRNKPQVIAKNSEGTPNPYTPWSMKTTIKIATRITPQGVNCFFACSE